MSNSEESDFDKKDNYKQPYQQKVNPYMIPKRQSVKPKVEDRV